MLQMLLMALFNLAGVSIRACASSPAPLLLIFISKRLEVWNVKGLANHGVGERVARLPASRRGGFDAPRRVELGRKRVHHRRLLIEPNLCRERNRADDALVHLLHRSARSTRLRAYEVASSCPHKPRVGELWPHPRSVERQPQEQIRKDHGCLYAVRDRDMANQLPGVAP